ncbi:MAG: hypothetical protein MSH60_07440 [Ruminococcus sp.]|nr:hypothetical protein [Ruminococcus sp.]
MLRISDESYERVQNAIEDIGYCCVTEDDYNEWEDIAASSIEGFIDSLNDEQLAMTCAAFREYIIDTEDGDLNLAMGIKTALARALREMLDYIGDVSDDEDDEYDEEDSAVALVAAIKKELEIMENMEIGE